MHLEDTIMNCNHSHTQQQYHHVTNLFTSVYTELLRVLLSSFSTSTSSPSHKKIGNIGKTRCLHTTQWKPTFPTMKQEEEGVSHDTLLHRSQLPWLPHAYHTHHKTPYPRNRALNLNFHRFNILNNYFYEILSFFLTDHPSDMEH